MDGRGLRRLMLMTDYDGFLGLWENYRFFISGLVLGYQAQCAALTIDLLPETFRNDGIYECSQKSISYGTFEGSDLPT